MSLTRKIAHNTIIQITGKTISVALGLVAISIMTRILGVEKFGWYITATGFLQFIGIFSDFGFTITTANMLSEPRFDKQKLLNNLFTWRFITAFIFQALAPVIILLFPYPAPIKIAVAITTVSFFAISLNNVFIGYFQSQLKMIFQTVGELLSRVILVVGLLLVAYKHYDFLSVMTVITLASVAYTVILIINSPKIKFGIDKIISKAIFQKMWPTAVTVIFNVFYLQGDRVILPLYVSQADMGLYGAAYRVLDIVTQVAAIIMGIMMPLITYAWSRGLKQEFAKHYQNSLDLVMFILLPMLAGIIALANPIINLIASKEFASAAIILQFLSLAILGISFGNIFGYIALAINRQRQAIWVYVSVAVVTTILYFILIPRYGIYGAAWASVFSELLAGFSLMILVSHYSGLRPKFFTFIKIIVASAIMGYTIYIVQPLNIIISILLGAGIYFIFSLLFKIITKQTLKEILTK